MRWWEESESVVDDRLRGGGTEKRSSFALNFLEAGYSIVIEGPIDINKVNKGDKEKI